MSLYRRKFEGGHRHIMSNLWLRRTKLLNMMYTSTELAEELSVERPYLTENLVKLHGMPAQRDEKGRYWFNGLDVRKWIEKEHNERQTKKKSQTQYADNEFYCIHCRKRVFNDDYKIERPQGGGHFMKRTSCPECGRDIFKFTKEFIDDIPTKL